MAWFIMLDACAGCEALTIKPALCRIEIHIDNDQPRQRQHA